MMQPRIIRVVMVLAWMALIYFFSSRPDLHSGLQPMWDFILRKIAHALEYGILAILLTRAITMTTPRKRDVLIGIVAASLYAITDEYHQTFIAGRHGSPIDWLIDTCGAILVVVFWRRMNAQLDADVSSS